VCLLAGQLSQVIYLHNLQFKQGVPPNTVLDWKDDSAAGPIAAFLQLITDLEIWLPDSDDPLGILGDTTQIRRPLDHNRETTETTDDNDEQTAPDLTQKVGGGFLRIWAENVSEPPPLNMHRCYLRHMVLF